MNKEKVKRKISWVCLLGSLVGLAVTFPLWLMNLISDRQIIGITLALTWLDTALPAFNAILLTDDA